MPDILFKTDDFVFSYRVAGICIHDGRVLLQKPTNDTGFAFPGGHVTFGETNEQTLIREFKEEIGADISVGGLKWVGEIFFPWGDRPCHQICLYNMVDIPTNAPIPFDGKFIGAEHLEGRDFDIEFYWIPPGESKLKRFGLDSKLNSMEFADRDQCEKLRSLLESHCNVPVNTG